MQTRPHIALAGLVALWSTAGAAQRADTTPPAATAQASSPRAAARATEPGEMTLEQAQAYFRDLRRWHRHRYDHPVTLGVGVGFGYGIDSPDFNPYRLSLGGSVGYTFPVYNVYLGLTGVHYFGEKLARGPQPETASAPAGQYTSNRLAVDYGYEFIFRHVRMRALLSGGGAMFDTPEVILIVPTLGFGGTLLLPLGNLFVAADARMDFQFARDDLAAHSLETTLKLGLRI